jgi:hypothetical protein
LIDGIIKETRIPLVLFPYHLLCAEIAEHSRRRKTALTHYEAAADELERHQARLHHNDLRATFFKGQRRAYEALVRLSLDAPENGESLSLAYAWCERARSRGLVELLSQHAPVSRGQVGQSLLARINRLREELNTHYVRSQPETRPIHSATVTQTMVLKEQELARALGDVSTADPELGSLQQVSIATLESVQRLLPKETTLVEYFTTGDEILVFIVSREDARVVRRVCPASRVLNLQERLGFQLEKLMLGGDYVGAQARMMLDSTNDHLNKLYRSLVAPFISGIRTHHILIVPHGSLHFLPFHASTMARNISSMNSRFPTRPAHQFSNTALRKNR